MKGDAMSNINKRSVRSLLMVLFASFTILCLCSGSRVFAAPAGFTASSWGYRYTGTSAFVEIPSEITQVNRYMFDENNYVRGVYIPGHVRSVSSYAFYRCRNLKFIWIGSSATSVDQNFKSR